jgi:POT family proton-dependent oligopeptide transporter
LSGTAIDSDTDGERPPPEDDHAFFGRPEGLVTPSGLGVSDDDRRDAGLAPHSMTTGIGAFAGPLATGRLGEHQGRHRGFSAAAIGMTLGPIPYVTGGRHLAGRRHSAAFAPAPRPRRTMPPVH